GTGGDVGAFSVSDWQDLERRSKLEDGLRRALSRLAGAAWRAGLEALYVENLAAAREPSTMEGIQRLLRPGDDRHVPVALCLDVGHQCVPGTTGAERDPYAWLERMGSKSPVVQLQQSDPEGDHQWPFTADADARGRIDADKEIAELTMSGYEGVAMILDVS